MNDVGDGLTYNFGHSPLKRQSLYSWCPSAIGSAPSRSQGMDGDPVGCRRVSSLALADGYVEAYM